MLCINPIVVRNSIFEQYLKYPKSKIHQIIKVKAFNQQIECDIDFLFILIILPGAQSIDCLSKKRLKAYESKIHYLMTHYYQSKVWIHLT